MIYVFLAEGFEEIEALATVDVLRRAELPVQTVGVGGDWICGSHGMRIQTDIREEDVELAKAQVIVLPGGMPGTRNLEASADVQRALDYMTENDRYIAAICAAPSILGHRGQLNGKRATCFPGFEKDCSGAVIFDEPAVADGRIITGKGAGAAIDFALTIVEQLKGRSVSDALRAAMQCR
ncbi:MAG: DJ-1/PfpI family protein [Clostridiales bacterium]|nr:DJ-1/PfpI family protein [Clostridiales bacterium]